MFLPGTPDFVFCCCCCYIQFALYFMDMVQCKPNVCPDLYLYVLNVHISSELDNKHYLNYVLAPICILSVGINIGLSVRARVQASSGYHINSPLSSRASMLGVIPQWRLPVCSAIILPPAHKTLCLSTKHKHVLEDDLSD